MLLTKPLTQLLHSSLTPTLTTLLLITPSGQLLASASSLPSSILRSRATLAMSIWEVYQENGGAVEAALPETDAQKEAETQDRDEEDGSREGDDDNKVESKIQTITLQVTLAILTLRRLSCGLLVMGMSDTSTPTSTQNLPSPSPTTPRNPLSNQGSLRGKGKMLGTTPPTEGMGKDGLRSYAGSEAGSIGTLGGRGREVQAVRRGTETASKWLERELVGFEVRTGI